MSPDKHPRPVSPAEAIPLPTVDIPPELATSKAVKAPKAERESTKAEKPRRPEENLFENFFNKRNRDPREFEKWFEHTIENIENSNGVKKSELMKRIKDIREVLEYLADEPNKPTPQPQRKKAERALGYLAATGVVDLSFVEGETWAINNEPEEDFSQRFEEAIRTAAQEGHLHEDEAVAAESLAGEVETQVPSPENLPIEEEPKKGEGWLPKYTEGYYTVSVEAAKGLEEDPRYREIFQNASLSYLTTKDSRWFSKEYSGVGSSGYLLDKKGIETSVLPSQAVGPAGIEQVTNSAKAQFAAVYPEDAARYAGKISEPEPTTPPQPEVGPAAGVASGAILENLRVGGEVSTSEVLPSIEDSLVDPVRSEIIPPPVFKEEVKKPKTRRKITIVDARGAKEAAARDMADRRMTASQAETQGPRLFRGKERTSKEQLTGFKNVLTNVWKHNLFREYYRQKELTKARGEIVNNEDERQLHVAAMGSMVERFSQEYDEVIHERESRRMLGGAEGIVGAEDQKIKDDIRDLIKRYAGGLLDELTFRQERSRLLSAIHGVPEKEINDGVEYGDNLLEIARQVKLSVAHGEGLEDLDLEFDVTLGHARAGVRTEAKFGAVDGIIETVQSSAAGRFFNETTVTSAVAIAYSLGAFASQRVARSKLLAWGSFGATALFGAGIAGGRESVKLEEERSQHSREMAQGRTFNATESPRRNEMQEHTQNMRSASELANQLEDALYTISPEGTRELKDLSVEQVRHALAQIASIEARIRLSDRNDIDLIAYSGDATLEQERLRLDILRAQAKVDIRNRFAGHDISSGKDSDAFLKQLVDTETSLLRYGEGGVEKKNELFKKMKHKKVAVAALKGLATGLAVGGALQEVGAFFKASQQGFFERFFGGKKASVGPMRLTPMEYMRDWFSDSLPSSTGVMHEVGVGPGTLSLPEGYDLIQEANGTFSIQYEGDTVAEYVGFDADGSLTDRTEQQLAQKGFVISSQVEHLMHDSVGSQTPEEFVGKPGSGTTEIDRALWYDNDTPKPVFDKNELRLWWGGEHNTGIDPKSGEYVFSVARMSEDGSYHDKFSADAQKLMKAGNLKLLLSVSQDTQGSVFEIPIDAQGNARIDPNSEIGKLLFSQEGGKAQFLGRYAEVAEMLDSTHGAEDAAEKVRILATHVGEGVDAVPTIVQTPEEHIKTILDAPSERHLDPPLVIPVLGRRPLEPTGAAKKREIVPVPGYFRGYGYEGKGSSDEYQKQLKAQLSESLRKNPSEKLDFKKEVGAYLDKQPKGRKEQIRTLASSVEPMSPECALSICIPVAGHQEGKNIYRTLSNYLNQTADKKNFEIVLFVNHPDRDKEGNLVHPDATLTEIEKFKEDHPELAVRMMYSVLPLEQAKIGNIRKILNDSVLQRSVNRGEDARDVIMVSNDADNWGVVPEYVSNYIEKFKEHDNVDALLGQLDWDHETYVKSPLIHVSTRLFQYLDVQLRHSKKHIASSGANFAFRSSIYAAVNGYETGVPLGEDVQLGEKIKVARDGSPNNIGVAYAGARVSRIYTSARRSEATLEAEKSPIEQWDDGFGAFDAIRTKEFKGESFDFEDENDRKRFTIQAERMLSRTIERVSPGGAYDPMVRRALGWLGIKYKVVGKYEIKITDASKLIEGLKEYKEDALPFLERRLNS